VSRIEPIPDGALQSIARDLAESFTHARLTDLFAMARIEDDGTGAKWSRIYHALVNRQTRDRAGNAALAFIQTALAPTNFIGRREEFEGLCERTNLALSFSGVMVAEDGTLRPAPTARTLSEAERRADKLRSELTRRNVHPDVLRFCRAELLAEDYFHATFEATKSIADKIRALTGLTLDGTALVDQAFALSGAGPYLLFNGLADETDRSEHNGLANLIRGLFGVFRNIPAHRPRLHATMTEREAFDLFTLASYLHRRLDAASRTSRTPA
jgi:uncharacterized protein (TIGR02391 family)